VTLLEVVEHPQAQLLRSCVVGMNRSYPVKKLLLLKLSPHDYVVVGAFQ
jgi:hypothetical protein